MSMSQISANQFCFEIMILRCVLQAQAYHLHPDFSGVGFSGAEENFSGKPSLQKPSFLRLAFGVTKRGMEHVAPKANA
jgi:hypothetical protein